MESEVIFKARLYLSHIHPDLAELVEDMSDDRVLREVNRLFFGGIQRFVRVMNKKGDLERSPVFPKPSTKGSHGENVYFSL